MADTALFVGWGSTVRGREAKSLEVFNETIAFYGKCQEQGAIESFEIVLLDPHGGDLDGFVLIRGSADQIHALEDNEEFLAMMTRANLIVERLGLVRGSINEGVARQVGLFQGAIDQVVGAGA